MKEPHARLATALADRYRIERELGQGGMATVYLAEDLKHKRRVAVKVLKPELAAVLGAERFVQEITTTASLSHPHILPLFDSGTADGFLFYVMPYIEGETLRDKLNRETQLGVDEAVRIACEVADALDYAHRRGVIHRDIKPENILLHDGRPMVADFGIALAVSAAAGGRMTETGLSLGTPHYMSPEQATAEKEITGRSDIYSLASVLYEMLSGNPPHTGSSAQQIIMKIIAEPVEAVTKYRKAVPPHVAGAVARALEKLPADRFETAKAFADALKDSRFTYGATSAARASAGAESVSPASRRALAGAAALAVVGVGLGVWGLLGSRADDGPKPPIHLTLDLVGANPDRSRFAISSDGGTFAFATDEGIQVRDAGQREYRILPGTRAAESPAFSPDDKWIAFAQGGRLRKVAVSGGSTLALIGGDSVLASRLDWGADGRIVFESSNRLWEIATEGGAPRRLSATEGGASPRVLPDGSGVLYVDARRGTKLMLHDFASDTSYTILEESTEAQYVSTGHIVYAHPTGGLFAVRFDPRRRRVSGAPIPLVTDLQVNGTVAAFRVTPTGTLVYRAGLDPESRLLMRQVNGRIDTLPLAPRIFGYARFSPDGRSLALTIGSARGTNRHTAIYNLDLGTLDQLTLEGGGHAPVFSPKGDRLVFSAELDDSDAEDLFVQPLDRSSPPMRILRAPDDQHASAWPIESLLVVSDNNLPRVDGGSGGDIGLVDPRGRDGAARPYLAAQWAEADAAISPDGRYAAYTSFESGALEVYVRPFPDARSGGQWKISLAGGLRPRWGPDGRTVLYRSVDETTVHVVRLSANPPFAVLSRTVLFSAPRLGGAWDVDPRTGRIVAAQAVTTTETTRMVVVVNWLDLLRGR